ncbi:hypothetical protein [Akkermansia phage Chambord]|nr:hypothetical protein [Akkermansia phage Chambord]
MLYPQARASPPGKKSIGKSLPCVPVTTAGRIPALSCADGMPT